MPMPVVPLEHSVKISLHSAILIQIRQHDSIVWKRYVIRPFYILYSTLKHTFTVCQLSRPLMPHIYALNAGESSFWAPPNWPPNRSPTSTGPTWLPANSPLPGLPAHCPMTFKISCDPIVGNKQACSWVLLPATVFNYKLKDQEKGKSPARYCKSKALLIIDIWK